jgi:hypothetical protein
MALVVTHDIPATPAMGHDFATTDTALAQIRCAIAAHDAG